MMKTLVNNRNQIEYSNIGETNNIGSHPNVKKVKSMKISPLEKFFKTFLSTLTQDEVNALFVTLQKFRHTKTLDLDEISDEMIGNIETFKWNLNNWKLMFSDFDSE